MSNIRHPVDVVLVDAGSLWLAGLVCFMGFTERKVCVPLGLPSNFPKMWSLSGSTGRSKRAL
jgi:hypothetical protein